MVGEITQRLALNARAVLKGGEHGSVSFHARAHRQSSMVLSSGIRLVVGGAPLGGPAHGHR